MYIFVVNILPLVLGLIIAYLLAVIGKKRQIGFEWAFYFGLIFPLLALFLVLSSKKQVVPFKRIHIIWKFISVVMILIGILYVNTAHNIIIPEINNEKPINSITTDDSSILNDSSINFGRIIGGGVISQLLNLDAYLADDYRGKRYLGYFSGLIFISLGCYILRPKRNIPSSLFNKPTIKRFDCVNENSQFEPTRDSYSNRSEEAFVQDLKETPVEKENYFPQTFLYSKDRKIKNIRYLSISILSGFLLGWYYKVPNVTFLTALAQSDSMWRKDIIIELQRKQASFFSTELFSFNWMLFILSSLLCYFMLLYFNDEKFRQNVRNKLNIQKLK